MLILYSPARSVSPSLVKPEPLVGVLADQPHQSLVVQFGVLSDIVGYVAGPDRLQGGIEPHDMLAVRIAIARDGYDRSFGCEGDHRKTSEGVGRVSHEVDEDPVSPSGVVIEDEYHRLLSA